MEGSKRFVDFIMQKRDERLAHLTRLSQKNNESLVWWPAIVALEGLKAEELCKMYDQQSFAENDYAYIAWLVSVLTLDSDKFAQLLVGDCPRKRSQFHANLAKFIAHQHTEIACADFVNAQA